MLVLLILWTAYFTLHSLLASGFLKEKIASLMGKGYRFYRLIYNLIALGGFAGIVWYQQSLTAIWLVPSDFLMRLAGGITIIIGLFTGLVAILKYNLGEFSGLSYLRKPHTPGGDVLVTSGLNRYVRHPLYFATIIILTGYLLTSFTNHSLLFVFITFCYLIIGTILEERKLIDTFGEEYLEYKRNVKMLIPFVL